MTRKGSAVNVDTPAPTILTHGRRGTHNETTLPANIDAPEIDTLKPSYRVPLMSDIVALPRNGYTVISTFSGCGGSCLGFEMEGYQVLWASEFIPAAQDVYRLNHPDVTLDTRDIRTVTAADILTVIGKERGDIDVLEGSPPCASFSTAGKRERGWGKVNKYSDTTQRSDDLFDEYIRLLDGLQPRVFVAENVSGLVKGTAKGYFKRILQAMKDCGYQVEARLLDAQWLGVPQMRQRIIFVGVRNDLGLSPAFPKPLPYRYSVRDALPWIIRQGDNGGFGGGEMRDTVGLGPTVGASPQTGNGRFPASAVEVEGANGFNGHAGRTVEQPASTLESSRPVALRAIHDTGGKWGCGDITDRPSPAVTVGNPGAPNSNHFQIEETDISRYAIGREWDKLAPGESTYYGGRLWKPSTEKPCPTVTQTGGNIGAASVTHPTERRKFTIAELKHICAFPDDFHLTGTYAQQWERLGRAVPPVMMSHVARVIRDDILERIER